MNSIKGTVAFCLIFITAVLLMFYNSKTRMPQLTEDQMRQAGIYILPKPRELLDFELQDHTGAPFVRENLTGGWSFLFFGFTSCPDVCPTSMSVLGKVRSSLEASEYEFDSPFKGLLVTVDPERDDPKRLGEYATAFSPDFLGITGSKKQLEDFARQLNVAFVKVPLDDAGDGLSSGDYTVDHTGNIVIVNPLGHYHGFIKLPHKADMVQLTYQTLDASF